MNGFFRLKAGSLKQGLLLSILFILFASAAYADAPDFESLTNNLELNRKQVEYLDISLTNLTVDGDERSELESGFREAMKYDYHANIALMMGQYNEGTKILHQGRKHLHSVYVRVMEYYNEETLAMFKAVAPLIVRTRDPDAGYFLRTGYGNLAQAKKIYTMTFNTYPGNDLNKIESYREAIRYIRLSRRFLMLALINANLPREEKPVHEFVSYKKAKNGNNDGESVDFYEKVRYLILRLIQRKLLAREIRVTVHDQVRRIPILDIHRDDYGYLVQDKISVRQKLIKSLENEEFNTDGLRPESNGTGSGTPETEKSPSPDNTNPN